MEYINIEELVKLRKEGLSYEQIEKHFLDQGKEITAEEAALRLRVYYDRQQRAKSGISTWVDVNIEEIVNLKEQGLLHREIVEHFRKKGISISQTTISNRLREYYQKFEKPKIKKKRRYEDELKEILMSGMSIEEFVLEFEMQDQREEIEKRLKKLRLAAVCQERENGEFVPDTNFEKVLNIIENSLDRVEIYYKLLNQYISNGECVKGGMEGIKDVCFSGNTDLMMYILLRMDLQYPKGYDLRAYKIFNEQYEQKIDKYLARVYSVEDSRLKHLNDGKNSEKAGNSHEEK